MNICIYISARFVHNRLDLHVNANVKFYVACCVCGESAKVVYFAIETQT